MSNSTASAVAALQPFDFNGNRIRVIMIDGEPWFVAADVCMALDITNVSQAMTRLDEDEYQQVSSTLISNESRSGAGPQSLTVVSESGLYELVLGSRKPEARAFKRWIKREVLPSIRKTGAYGVQRQLTNRELAMMVIEESDRADREALRAERAEDERTEAQHELAMKSNSLTEAEKAIEASAGDVLFSQDYLSTTGWKSVAQYGRDLGVGPLRIVRILRELGIYQKVADIPYAEHVDAGRFRHDPVTGEVLISPKGEKWAHGLIARYLGWVTEGQERL